MRWQWCVQAKGKKWFKEKWPTRSKADECLSMMRLKKISLEFSNKESIGDLNQKLKNGQR